MIYWEVSGSAALMIKLIKIGLSGRVEAILREGVPNKMRRTGLKISGNIFYGLMNQKFEMYGLFHQYVQRRSGERYNNECLHGGSFVSVLHFSQFWESC